MYISGMCSISTGSNSMESDNRALQRLLQRQGYAQLQGYRGATRVQSARGRAPLEQTARGESQIRGAIASCPGANCVCFCDWLCPQFGDCCPGCLDLTCFCDDVCATNGDCCTDGCARICYCTDDCESQLNNCCYYCSASRCFCHYGCSTLGNCCDFCPSKHNTLYTDLRWSIH